MCVHYTIAAGGWLCGFLCVVWRVFCLCMCCVRYRPPSEASHYFDATPLSHFSLSIPEETHRGMFVEWVHNTKTTDTAAASTQHGNDRTSRTPWYNNNSCAHQPRVTMVTLFHWQILRQCEGENAKPKAWGIVANGDDGRCLFGREIILIKPNEMCLRLDWDWSRCICVCAYV